MNIGELYKENQRRRVLNFYDTLPTSDDRPSIVEFNRENRYIREGTCPVPGQYTPNVAPHMVEILERLNPDDPSTWIALLKGVQSTGTFHAELAMAYWIKFKLGSIGFFTATKELAATRSSANIDVMIDDTIGLSELVKPHSARNARKKADSTYYKEFVGGIKMIISSYGSLAGMKSNTMGLIILDECEDAEDDIKGQGDVIKTIEGRTIAVRRFKIFAVSTSGNMETSNIYRLYKQGDQRKYNMPCPKCGELQVLEFMENDMKYGLTFACKPGADEIIEPDSVRYICRHCGDYFKESKKQWMLENGIWIPTANPPDPNRRSYHVSGLLSPEQMLSWTRICTEYLMTNRGKKTLEYKVFVINFKGEAYRRVEKESTESEFRRKNLCDYHLGEVPKGKLILMSGADVQKNRVELLVQAVGKGFSRALVDVQVFHGNPANPDDMVWRSLADFVNNHTYKILGEDHNIQYCAIDCGYDPKEARRKDWNDKSHTVYNFVGMNYKFYAVRGTAKLKLFDVVRVARTHNELCPDVYMLNTPLLKDMLSTELAREDIEPMVMFPDKMEDGRPLDNEIIKQFLSEKYMETKDGTMAWVPIRSRNEVLDMWNYATGLGYILKINTWSDMEWDNWKMEIS